MPLGAVVEFKGGGTPNRKVSEYWDGGIPWATVKDFNTGNLLKATKEFISEYGLTNSATRLIPKGTVIIPTRMALGKAVIANIDVTINQDLKAVIPCSQVNPKYLLWFFICNSAHIESLGKGATVKGVTLEQLRRLHIRLPPLPEQRRIAAILDKADALRQKRREAIAKLDQLLQSVFLEMFGDPVTNPKGWKTKSLDESSQNLKRGPFGGALKKEIFVADGYKVYEQQHAISADFSIGRYFIDGAKFREMEAFSIRPNDLIVSCSGTMGRVAVAPTGVQPGVINQALLKITLNEHLLRSEFGADCLRTTRMQSHLFGISRGSGLKNFPPMSDVRSLRMIIPPIEQQEKYLDIKAHIEKMRIAFIRAEMNDLFSSLQQRAFTGHL